jgi:tungstate transport system substrate-binding protein
LTVPSTPWPLAAPVLVLAGALLGSCGGDGDEQVVLGAPTSVQDSGLLDEVVREFEGVTNYDVKPLVGGSGQMLEMARQGEFDVILTHSPADEDKFIADGEGVEKRPVMRNFFVIAGPETDPAGVRGSEDIRDALGRIAAAGQTFVSRGDNSGTHRREQSFWEELGIAPENYPWYQVSGSGQGQSLLVAADKDAYTLVDSSTFAAFRERVDLKALFTDNENSNLYSVIRVSPDKHDVNAAGAVAFAEFLISQAGQCLIANFGVEEYGEPLFEPLFGCSIESAG